MRRALLLITLILLLLSSSVAAENKKIYDAWVYPGDTFTLDDRLFSVSAGSSTYSILLEEGNNRHLIGYDSCALSSSGLELYCFNTSDYIACQKGDYACGDKDGYPDDWCCPYDVAHLRFEAGQAVWAVKLQVFEVTPQITVTRTVDDKVLKLSEQAKVTITFENTGTDAIKSAKYVEHIPEGFSVLNAYGLTKSGNDLLATITLSPGDTKKLSYNVEPKEYTSGKSFTGNLTYFYQDVEQKVSPAAFTINVPSPFTITHTLSEKSREIGGETTYTYSLKNNDGQAEMAVELQFTIDPAIVKTRPKDVDDDLLWEDEIAKGETETFTFTLRSDKTGGFPVTAEATMTVNGERFTSRVQDTFTSTITPFTPTIRVSKEPLKGGQQYTLRLLLANENEQTPLYDVQSKVWGGALKGYSLTRKSVEPGETPLVAELELSAPAVENDTSLSFTWNGTYKTKAGEQFNFSEKKSVTLIPASQSFLITQTINQTEAAPGDELSVAVTVKNRQDAYRDVSVTDILPSGAFVVSGIREKAMSLTKDEERDAYEYHVAVPESFDGSIFTITTRVFDQQEGLTYETSTDVAIIGRETTNTTAADDVDENPVVEKETEKKKGFFRRVIEGVIGFFEGIFS